MRVGVIGCGTISSVYLRNCRAFANLDVVAVADLDEQRALAQAERFGVPRVLAVDEVFASSDVDVILDLTVPGAHAELNRRALEAGKHVYSEKPWATTREAGWEVLQLARQRGLYAGASPDTFLGNALQSARRLIDEGAIGEPVAALGAFLGSGPERWHPSPEFFYEAGGGPLFDMGPYYLTALISLLGPVRRVSSSARITHPRRTIGAEARRGETIPVHIPTHVSATLDFASGPVGTVLASFDVQADTVPFIEIYGAAGTLVIPDPNRFDGPLRLFSDGAWRNIPAHDDIPINWRGVGLADMAAAIHEGRPHRANAHMAYHVLDIMGAIHEASKQDTHVYLNSSCERPQPLPQGPAAFPTRHGEFAGEGSR